MKMIQDQIKQSRTSTLGRDQTDLKAEAFDRWLKPTVAAYRILHGLSMADVVKRSGMSQGKFYRVMKKPSEGSVAEIMRILDAVHCPAEERHIL